VREAPRSPEPLARLHALALALHPGVGPVAYRDRVATFGSAARAFETIRDDDARHAALVEASAVAAEARTRGARLLLLEDADYPAPLLELTDPPPFLFTDGEVGTLTPPAVAIVGTRGATAYGERVAAQLASALSSAGVCVVSGLARGIDGVAHRATLEARGRTAAVLGTGIDVVYPRAHRDLQRRIARDGVIISEWPCGTTPTAGSFPRRNRIIAALCAVTIVVEAGVKSGALLTAGMALELGRTVAAVPGPIDAPQSAGSNELLRDGAVVIADVADALALFGVSVRASVLPALVGDERTVWSALDSGALGTDALAARAGLSLRRCLAVVTSLEVAGLVTVDIGGDVRRSRG
jgi:DNA processing protein